MSINVTVVGATGVNATIGSSNGVSVSVGGTIAYSPLTAIQITAGANITVTTSSGTFVIAGRDVPVQSVQGRTGSVIVTRSDLTAAHAVHSHVASDISNLTSVANVVSVNGRTGAVSILAGANVTVSTSTSGITISSAAGGAGGGAVSSVNGRTGAVSLSSTDVSAASAAHTHTAFDVTNLTNVANVVSVNGRTGVVSLNSVNVSAASAAHTHTAFDITNLTSVANVVSVNGRTGVVTLNSTSLSAAPATHTHAAFEITNLTNVANVVSVNGRTGVVAINSADVSAASAVHTHVASDISNLTSVANVVSVNGRTGVVSILAGANVTVSTSTSGITVAAGGGGAVSSVNGRTAAVTLNSTDVSAASAVHSHVATDISNLTSVANVVSVNGRTGVVTLNSTDVSAASAVHSHVAADISNLTTVANVVSVNGITGTPVIVGGANVSVTKSGSTITIEVTGGSTQSDTLSDATPQNLGTATAGSSILVSRADHVHQMPSASQVGAASAVHTHATSDITNLTNVANVVSVNGLTGVVTINAGNFIEQATINLFPAVGETKTLYVATDVSKVYRWDAGQVYVELGPGEYKTTASAPEVVVQPAAGSAVISWKYPASNGGSEVLFYLVEFSADNGSSWTQVTMASPSTFSTTKTNLTPGQTYLFRVAAITAVGTGQYSASVSSTIFSAPSAPTGVAAAAGAQLATVSWVAPANSGGAPVEDYLIQQSADSGATWASSLDPVSTATNSVVRGLANGVSYVFRVAAKNTVGTSPWSSASAAVIPSTTPAAPAGLAVSPGDSQISAAWGAPSGRGRTVTDYVVQYALASNGAWQTFSDGVGTATSTVITGLTNGAGYIVRVAGENANGVGDFSPQAFATPRGAPSAPASISVDVGVATATVSWGVSQNNGSDVSAYSVEYSSNAGSTWTAAEQLGASPRSRAITGLVAGQSYLFRVASANEAGYGPYITSTSFSIPNVPGAPTAVSAVARNRAAIVQWTPPASTGGAPLESYVVEFSANSGSSWSTGPTVLAPSTTATVNNLTNGTAYVFRVAAVNAVGAGQQSAASSAVTPVGTVPGLTQTPSLTVGNASISLSWSAPSDDGGSAITGYVVQYAVVGQAYLTFRDGGGTATTSNVTGLTNGVQYVFRVAAKNAVGTGPLSQPTLPFAPAAAPAAPTISSAVPGNQNVLLSWTPGAANGAAITAYSVQYKTQAASTWQTIWATESPVRISSLANGTAYVFRVAGVNFIGTGAYSAESAAVTPAPDVPGNVTGLAHLASSQTPTMRRIVENDGTVKYEARLRWDAPQDNGGSTITDYVVQYAIVGSVPAVGDWSLFDSAPWVTVDDGQSAALTATVLINAPTLASGQTGTTVFFRVAAVNASGVGPYREQVPAPSSRIVFAFLENAPSPPLFPTASSGNQAVSLAWGVPAFLPQFYSVTNSGIASGASKSPTNYLVQYRAAGSPTWTSVLTNSTSRTWSTGGLTNGTQYEFRVAAICELLYGDFSSVVSATPSPTAPTMTSAPGFSFVAQADQYIINWSPASNGGSPVTLYEVWAVNNASPATYALVGTTSSTSVAISRSSLQQTFSAPCEAVKFIVRAANAVGTSGFSPPSDSVPTYQSPYVTVLTATVVGSETRFLWSNSTNTDIRNDFFTIEKQDFNDFVMGRDIWSSINSFYFDGQGWRASGNLIKNTGTRFRISLSGACGYGPTTYTGFSYS